MSTVRLYEGDCLDVLRTFPDNSIAAVVTDPPYGLSNTSPDKVAETLTAWVAGDRGHVPAGRGFMGATWDGFVPPPAVWDEVYRVLKPGGHALVFAGARTQDLMGMSLRLARFDLRDSVAWLYGSGFPKSLDVSKAIDKRGGASHLTREIGEAIKAARESRGWSRKRADDHFCDGSTNWSWFEGRAAGQRPPTPETFAKIVAEWPELADYAAKVAEAEREVVGTSGNGIAGGTGRHAGMEGAYGFGAEFDITKAHTSEAAKWEGWGTALKPGHEPIILARKPFSGTVAANVQEHGTGALNIDATRIGTQPAGRWPTNVALDPDTAKALDQQSGIQRDGVATNRNRGDERPGFVAGAPRKVGSKEDVGYGGQGGASRFFKVVEPDPPFMYTAKAPKRERPNVDGVQHPTVKPLKLIEYLVTLVTPPGGTVLDLFGGSGTTAEAALRVGRDCIIIEEHAPYIPLIRQRVDRATATKEGTE